MPKYTIYHNPRCTKSRQTLELLEDSGIEPTVVEYLKTPLTEKELLKLLDQLDAEPKALVRVKEDLFKEHRPKIETKADVAKALAKYPKLMERPVVVSSAGKAVLGRPPENVKALF